MPGHSRQPSSGPMAVRALGDPAQSSEPGSVILCPWMEHGPIWVPPLQYLIASTSFPSKFLFSCLEADEETGAQRGDIMGLGSEIRSQSGSKPRRSLFTASCLLLTCVTLGKSFSH